MAAEACACTRGWLKSSITRINPAEPQLAQPASQVVSSQVCCLLVLTVGKWTSKMTCFAVRRAGSAACFGAMQAAVGNLALISVKVPNSSLLSTRCKRQPRRGVPQALGASVKDHGHIEDIRSQHRVPQDAA